MIHELYKSNIISENWPEEKQGIDLLFLAKGSDYRAYETLRLASKEGVKIKQIVIFDFTERKSGITQQQEEMLNSYKTLGFSEVLIEGSIRNPSEAVKKIEKSIDLTNSERIGLDISCFTKPYFFTLMNFFAKVVDVTKLSVFYTEPNSYIFEKGLYNEYHSSVGPIRVEEIPSFNGDDRGKAKNLLVVILGFDGDLFSEINEDVAPKDTKLVNGFPSYSPKFKDISLISNEKHVNTNGNELMYCRANNPFEAYNLLNSISSNHPQHFINIAPLGTKPMALGCCLFAIHNPDVRVVYPMPENFKNTTTDNCWHTWQYEIELKN